MGRINKTWINISCCKEGKVIYKAGEGSMKFSDSGSNLGELLYGTIAGRVLADGLM